MTVRAVLDTNVFISGIFWEGNYCSQIIGAWRAGKVTLVTSLEIIQELVETLRAFKIRMPEEMIDEWRKTLVENAVVAVPATRVKVVQEDPADNKFFEAAIAGNAQYVVSQDKQVLKVGQYGGIKTVSPPEFLKRM